jgi:hypothetical protein
MLRLTPLYVLNSGVFFNSGSGAFSMEMVRLPFGGGAGVMFYRATTLIRVDSTFVPQL